MRHFFKKMKTEQLYSLFKESAGVSTDTRTIRQGEIFFALWGNKYNGNLYAADAIQKGASYAVIDDPLYETDKTILVDDTLFELQALATHHRKEMKIPVLAITGTNGKTTTKDLIAAVMSKKRKVHYTKGNLNNHIGVPLTILSTPPETELLIVEMGANHIGEIRTLCLIARPDYGIITNIGSAHLEGFGSFEGVIKAKTELYEYLKKVNGIALYNDRNPLLAEKIFRLVNRAVPYSDPTGIPLKVDLLPSGEMLNVVADYQHKSYTIKTNLFGKYNLENIKAAIAAGLFLDSDMESIVEAISSYVPGNNRSQIKVTPINTIICDSYNANPESMRKSIESFGELKADKKLIVLGDMLELGDKSQDEHMSLLKTLNNQGIDKVVLVGPVFKSLCTGFGYRAFRSSEEFCDYLRTKPIKGHHILVKGSRGMMLEKIYDLL
jgi:UDP-N-acetylmuramoyl-tripeptide--D-alanyl-D-alanine ligase